MDNRLQQFLAAENISQSQFADSINVAKASVSHILAGRNKPGFDFIDSMSRRYPNLNIEWFITGKGKMYKGQEAESETAPSSAPAETQDEPQEFSLFSGTSDNEAEASPANVEGPAARKSPKITKVLIFFDNGTYREIL